jgi:DNA mismatch repair protein MutL
VNQQKAHERILFEQYLSAFDNPRSAIQKKLFPKTIELSSTDSVLLGGILEDMRLLGFDIENFGSNTYVIHAMPEDIREEYLEDVIHSLLEQEKDAQKLSLKDYRVKLSKTIAKKSALRIGTEMSSSAIAHLIDSLFACEMPAIGVDGTPTFIALTFDDIESQFR